MSKQQPDYRVWVAIAFGLGLLAGVAATVGALIGIMSIL